MNIQAYSIVAMIGRYILIAICFWVFVQAILEMKKASQYNSSLFLASLSWNKKKVVFGLAQENTVGRASGCDVVVKSPLVRRLHFQIYYTCKEWIIAPNKKAQVYINKFLIEDSAQIEDGDKITFGKQSMIFHIAPEDDGEDE